MMKITFLEVKNTLQTLINKQYVNLMNVKVYLHSEIPLDDEKPMEVGRIKFTFIQIFRKNHAKLKIGQKIKVLVIMKVPQRNSISMLKKLLGTFTKIASNIFMS